MTKKKDDKEARKEVRPGDQVEVVRAFRASYEIEGRTASRRLGRGRYAVTAAGWPCDPYRMTIREDLARIYQDQLILVDSPDADSSAESGAAAPEE